MLFKKSLKEIFFDIFNSLLMILVVVCTLYPILYVLFASFSDAGRLMQHRGILLAPLGMNVDAYISVFKNPMIAKGYLNTIFVVVVGSGLNILLSSIAAYFLSRRKVYWKNAVMVMMVITMFFSGGLIPFYLVVKSLGLMNSLWALILPSAISTYNVIVMRTSFQGIPSSLEESAHLDGAGHLTILFVIILPLSLPVISVMVLWYAVGHWNSWFNAAIFINNRQLFPLQLILREILILNEQSDMMTGVSGSVNRAQIAQTIKYATVMVSILPILCVYPYLQKHFVKGVMIGAIKD